MFVEVKARRAGSTQGPETPAMAVGPRKRAKLRGLAAAWLRERGYEVPRHRELRFDVIGLRLDGAGRVTEYEHCAARSRRATASRGRSCCRSTYERPGSS